MPLLAESLVDEWLNRQGFFTMRGIKDGINEIDLLGVRQTRTGLEGWHVEAQVSFRPVGYITKLTKERSRLLNKDRTSAWERPSDILHESVAAWVAQKFTAPDKQAIRERAWPKVRWSFHFVHGVVRSQSELEAIASRHVTVIPLYAILRDVCARNADHLTGAAGTDLADIVHYYQSQSA